MSYRPITDVWILTRAKLKDGVKFYGAYPGGFPERARVVLGASIDTPVLHVCGGMARAYPYPRGFGPWDRTMDLDPTCEPDYLHDVREPFPGNVTAPAMLIDPPYTEDDAAKYAPGRGAFPRPGVVLRNAVEVLPTGGRVGILHYLVPKTPAGCRPLAFIAVMVGQNNRMRAFTVFEKEGAAS